MREPEDETELGASWLQSDAQRPSAAAQEAYTSLDAPEIGDEEPELGL
jgi:hypothetical protein